MTDNLDIWNRLGKTDPSQTKAFRRAGGFSGTAIKPIWILKRMTEEFGPIGGNWGTVKPEYQVVSGDNRELLVFCVAGFWRNNISNITYGVGGDKVVSYVKADASKNRPERWENDDEAFKKAYTDALGNAFKQLGVGADVHMGLFEDSKYVDDARKSQTAKARNAEYEDFKAKIELADTVEQLTQLWKENKSLREMFHAMDEHYTNDLTQAASARRLAIVERDKLVASHGPGFINATKGEDYAG